MKKRIASTLLTLVLALALLPGKAQAANVIGTGTCGDSAGWSLDSNGKLTISGSGAMKDFFSYSGSDRWNGNCTTIKTVVISKGITSIGDYAFYECINLTSVTIPSTVTSIGQYAFSDCSSLKAINIPDGVSTIGPGAFMFSGLTKIDIPSSVTTLGSSAFQSCKSLTNATIPGSIALVSSYAFKSCENLTTITLPGCLSSLGYYSFYECNSLSTVYFGGSKSAWSVIDESIYNDSLTKANIIYDHNYSSNIRWDLSSDGTLTISGAGKLPNYGNSISDTHAPWYNSRSSIKKVIISDGITCIGKNSFLECSNLTTVQLSPSVVSIEYGAFNTCCSLTSINIPLGLTSVGDWAFYACSKLTDVYYGGSTTEWSRVKIGSYNDPFKNATKKYGSPMLPGASFIVTFDANGGSVSSTSKSVSYGGTYGTLPVPTRSGYTFAGWFTSSSGGTKITEATTVELTSKQTLYAHWTPLQFTVEFDATGGSVSPTSRSVSYEETYSSLPTPTRSGYTFDGWFTAASGGTEVKSSDKVTLTANQTLYAHWTATSYTVTFDSQGGSSVASETVLYGGKVPRPSDPVKSGCSFDGWFGDDACESAWNFAIDTVEGNITLYAKWVISCTVTFDPQGGSISPENKTVGSDGTLDDLPVPTYDNCHHFDGWYLEPSGTSVSTKTIFTEDTTVYAKWTVSHTEEDIPAVEATCTTNGKTAGKKCSNCEEILEAQITVPAIGHTEENIPGKDPTCTEDGLTGGVRCSVCGETTTAQETIRKTGHKPEDMPDVPPTCVATGTTGGKWCSVCRAQLEAPEVLTPTGQHVYEPPTEKIVKEADCFNDGEKYIISRCSVCQSPYFEMVIIPRSHNWAPDGEWVKARPATCAGDGVWEYILTCTACGENCVSETKTIGALGHTEETILSKAATCEEDGQTEWIKCSVCGGTLKEPEIIPATGHDWEIRTEVDQEPTCTMDGHEMIYHVCKTCGFEDLVDGRDIPKTGHTEEVVEGYPPSGCEYGLTDGVICSVCREILVEQEEIEGLGHDWDETKTILKIIAAPTCTGLGYHEITQTCRRCGVTFGPRAYPVPPLNHDWGDTGTTTITKQATCTEDGSQTTTGATCSRCGDLSNDPIVKPIPATGHNQGEEVLEKETAATCTQAGAKIFIRHCTNEGCDAVMDTRTEVIPAIGHHDYGDWVVTKKATATTDGAEERTCSVCKEKETRVLPATGTTPDIPKVYKITFDANGGVGGATLETNKDYQLDGLPDKPTRSGYTFDGWYTAVTGGDQVTTSMKFDKDTTVFAHWTKISGGSPTTEVPKVYKITFDANGGVGGTTLETNGNNQLDGLPDKPTRSGYTFDGWYTASTGGEQVTTSMKFDADTTVYAHWTKLPDEPSATRYQIYTPNYTSGGSVYVSHSSAAEGTRITIELSPRSGYEMDWLSVINLNTGRELSLTRRYDDEYTFIMPDSSVEVEVYFLSQYTSSGYWYVPEQTATTSKSNKSDGYYFKDGQIRDRDGGLVSYDSLLTRDMFLSVLYNMDPSSSDEQVFWAVKNNIIPDPWASGLQGMNKNITREQVAMILYCYSKHMKYDLSPSAALTGYADFNQMRAIAQPAMSWAMATGLITGNSSNKLAPRDTVTCGEADAILAKFLSTVAKS